MSASLEEVHHNADCFLFIFLCTPTSEFKESTRVNSCFCLFVVDDDDGDDDGGGDNDDDGGGDNDDDGGDDNDDDVGGDNNDDDNECNWYATIF